MAQVFPVQAAVACRLDSLVHAFATNGYSIDKFTQLQQYTAMTPVSRVVWVIIRTPLFALLGSILPSLIPLQDPRLSVRENPGYIAMAFLTCATVFFGTIIFWRAGVQVSSDVYTTKHALQVALITAVQQTAIAIVVASFWRFPIPMSWLVVTATTVSSLVVGHLLVFGKRCFHDDTLVQGIKRYMPAFLIQSFQLLLYPGFSVLFERANPFVQVLLTLLFPLIKYFIRHALKRCTRNLQNFSTEIAVSGVEICAALYQSMIMQNAPSKIAMGVIIGIDVLQGLISVSLFMEHDFAVPRHLVLSHTTAVINARVAPAKSEAISPTHVANETSSVTTANDEATQRVIDRRTVTHALQLVDRAESILLVEYLEVVVPLITTLFTAIACQLPSAQYNMRLRSLYFHPEQLHHAVFSVLLYAGLQLLSVAVMHLVMKYRYGMSAMYHLAFILEYHWESIIGKLLAWLPIILNFNVIHFGVDFSFKFDFHAMVSDESQIRP